MKTIAGKHLLHVIIFFAVYASVTLAQKAVHALPDGGTLKWVDTGSLAVGTRGGFFSINENLETPSAERNVLLVVKVQEPCWYCAVISSGTLTWGSSQYQGNVTGQYYPNMPVAKHYWFKTIGDALAKAEKENWEVTYLAVTRSMPFETTKTGEERVKQPDVVTTKRHYTLKESQ